MHRKSMHEKTNGVVFYLSDNQRRNNAYININIVCKLSLSVEDLALFNNLSSLTNPLPKLYFKFYSIATLRG